ncbi:probable plastid-lipid-associated protein 3, chloroplastic [Amaranthus tricolor]|uniref:probable plastid-lipid-associated protein 3, chloroplastic n=1 Tax=Amaranthus tricolor TaxID=29722 RepID=UPI0025870B7B|nr:probable plastid-lipid-associated protein 3, chloroplastic [Amaranthus tricolor]
MSLLSTPPSSILFLKTSNIHFHNPFSSSFPISASTPHLSLSSLRPLPSRIFSSRSSYSSDEVDDEWGKDPKPTPITPSSVDPPESNVAITAPDEWGEKSGPEPEIESEFSDPDPPIREDEDEWGPPSVDGVDRETNGSTRENKNWELKRCLIDSVYGSDFGFRASSEVRAEVSELVNQLEAANPFPNPTEVPGLLDGNWVLVYTAFSELLPLLAVGATPLLKVQQISQAIDTGSQTVENSTTLSSPFATFSFSATATFEVRSPSRVQVRFKEANFKPPEIKSRFDLPESVDIFGQSIGLSPVQQLLNPVQEAAASISRALYGLPSLKLPIPGERTASWLLFTYVDEDFRISRGDGGLFVLVREGSSLLD